MNEFKLFGKALQKPQLLESDKGYKYCYIFIEVDRGYKNGDGEACLDDFKITCFKNLAEEVCQKIEKGRSFIIKGRLQQNNFDKDNGEKIYRPELIGEKIYYTEQS